MCATVAALSRALLIVAVVCVVSLVDVAAARADGTPSPVYCATHHKDPACTVTVADPGSPVSQPVSVPQPAPTVSGGCTPPSGPGIPARVDCNGCVWSAWSAGPGLQDDPAYEQWLQAGGKGSLERETCYLGPTTAIVYLPPGAVPPPAGVPAAQLGAEAVSKLPLLAMVTGSAPGAAGRAFAMTFVNMPTFLWVDNADWHTYSATANDGFKAVTATATPASVTWNMGDGHVTRCGGPGVEWHPGVEQSPCSYAYTTSSVHQPQVGADVNDRPYVVTATVTYQVTWSCTGQCGGADAGSVGPVDGPSSRMALVVGEIQTVVTG